MDNTETKQPITSSDLATYVVCPEAWRLKRTHPQSGVQQNEHQQTVKELKKDWVKTQELSSQLRRYAKVAYLLLVIIVTILLLKDIKRTSRDDDQQLPPQQSHENNQ